MTKVPGDACADLILETTPIVMRAVRSGIVECVGSESTLPQFRVLRHLSLRDYCLSDLAQRQRVSLATMSKIVSGLVERGYVERSVERDDRRYLKLRLTAAGSRFYDRTHSFARRKIAQRIASLSAADRGLVESGMRALANAFAETPSERRGATSVPGKRKRK